MTSDTQQYKTPLKHYEVYLELIIKAQCLFASPDNWRLLNFISNLSDAF